MKVSIFLGIFLMMSVGSVKAQQYIFGKVANEEAKAVSGAQIVNLRTDEKTLTDHRGIFMLFAEKGDLIRIISSNYERKEFRAVISSYESPISVVLRRPAVEIPEVQIAFVPSGNLPRDVKAVDKPVKVKMLQNELKAYMEKPMAVIEPKLSMPQTLSIGPNYSAGQVNVIGLLGAVAGLVQKAAAPKITPPNYYEVQQFYATVKRNTDQKFLADNGLDDRSFDELLAYADQRFQLAKKYYRNYDHAAVRRMLQEALKDFRSKDTPSTSTRNPRITEETAA